MARQGAPGVRVRSAAEERPGGERGRPAAPGLAAMTEGGREGSELWWGRRHGKVALSSEEDARALRRQALPNVWHQRRAQRVRCMPGLGDAVKEKQGVETRRTSESPEGGAAGGAGLPPCRPKEEMTGEVHRRTERR